ncbi:hypothetical protein pb186bvf_017955 [Paramecium bursaria]
MKQFLYRLNQFKLRIMSFVCEKYNKHSKSDLQYYFNMDQVQSSRICENSLQYVII